MENRISVISIIIEDTAQAAAVNDLLHEYGSYIVGRMGIPYRERKVSIICIVMDAPGSVTSALSGKLGMLDGVSTKRYHKGKRSLSSFRSYHKRGMKHASPDYFNAKLRFLMLASFLAGFLDAIAGGGGLITIPAYLISGLPVHMVYACNKFASSCGTAIATLRYYRNKMVDIPVGLLAAAGVCALLSLILIVAASAAGKA